MSNSEQIDIKSFALATYTAFFRLSVDEPVTNAFFYFEILTRLIFEVSLPLSLSINGSKVFPIVGCRVLRALWTHDASMVVQQISAYLVALPILANFFFMAAMIYFYSSRRSDSKLHKTLSKIMQYNILWACGPLYIPYISIPLNYISCDAQTQSCVFFKVDPAETVFFIFLVVMHTLFSLIYSVSVFDWSPFSNHRGAQAHSRVNIQATLFKMAVSICFELIIKVATPTENFGLVIFCSIYHFYIAVSFWYDLPYFDLLMNKLLISVYAISFMASFSVLVQMVTADPADIVCIAMFILGSILILPTIHILTNLRVSNIGEKPLLKLTSDTEIDIRIRNLFRKSLSSQNTNFRKNDETQHFKNNIIPITPEYAEIDAILSHYERSFKHSFKFNLVWATYVFLFKGNKFLAVRKLRRIIESEPFIFDILPVEIRLRYVSVYSSSEEVEAGLLSYAEQLRLERIALKYIHYGLTYHLQFWELLKSSKYSTSNLEKIGIKIIEMTGKAISTIQRLIELDSKNPSYRIMYSFSLQHLLHDSEAAMVQARKAAHFERDTLKEFSLTDPSNCILIISGEDESFGFVMEMNRMGCEMLGVTRDQVIGKSLNHLLAKPFASGHNSHVQSYIEKKSSFASYLQKSQISFKHSNGLVFEADIRIHEYANFTLVPSITFFAIIVPRSHSMFCYVRKSDLVMTDVSLLFFTTFHLDMSNITNQRFKLRSIIPRIEFQIPNIEEALQHSVEYKILVVYYKSLRQPSYVISVSRLTSHFYRFSFQEKKPEDPLDYKSTLKYCRVESNLSQDGGKHFGRLEDNSSLKPKTTNPNLDSKIIVFGQSLKLHTNSSFRKISTSLQQQSSDQFSRSFEHKSKLGIAWNGSIERRTLRVTMEVEEGRRMERKASDNEEEENQTANDSSKKIITAMSISQKTLGLNKELNRKRHFLIQTASKKGLQRIYKSLLRWAVISLVVIGSMSVTLNVVVFNMMLERTSVSTKFLSLPLTTAISAGEFLGESLFFPFINSQLPISYILNESRPHMDTLGSFKDYLYSNEGSLTFNEVKFISDSLVNYTGYDDTIRQASITEYINMYFVAMSAIINAEQVFSIINSSYPQFLQGLATTQLITLWNSFCNQVISQSNEFLAFLDLFQTYLLSCVLLCLGFIVLAGYIPNILQHLKQIDSIYKTFDLIDINSIRDICKLYPELIQEIENYGYHEEDRNDSDLLIHNTLAFIDGTNSNSKWARIHNVFKRLLFFKYSWIMVLLLVIAGIYATGILFWWKTTEKVFFSDISSRVYLSQSRTMWLKKISLELTNWNSSSQNFDLNLDHLQSYMDVLIENEYSLFFSNISSELPNDIRLFPNGNLLLASSVCDLLLPDFPGSAYNVSSLHACQLYQGSLFSQDEFSVFMEYIEMAESLSQAYNQLALNDTLSLFPGYISQLQDFLVMNEVWLPLISKQYNYWVADIVQQCIQLSFVYRLAATVLLLVICLGLMYFVYVPSINQMNKDIHDTRNLLHIIPLEAIENNSKLRDRLFSIMQSMARGED